MERSQDHFTDIRDTRGFHFRSSSVYINLFVDSLHDTLLDLVYSLAFVWNIWGHCLLLTELRFSG